MPILLALRQEGDLEVTKQERYDRLKQLLARLPAKKSELLEVGEFTYGHPVIKRWDNTTKLKIGKFCSIGANVQIFLGGEHHTDTITTYPFDVLVEGKQTPSKGDVTIGNDVWIGNDVIILSGVTIGDGAVIGAGAVVTKDVMPYDISGSVPARALKWRSTASHVFKLRWWDWPIEKIAEAMPMLMDKDTAALIDFDKKWRELNE